MFLKTYFLRKTRRRISSERPETLHWLEDIFLQKDQKLSNIIGLSLLEKAHELGNKLLWDLFIHMVTLRVEYNQVHMLNRTIISSTAVVPQA